MVPDIVAHYRQLLATHGESSEAVQYRDKATHYARFRLLTAVDPDMASVLDVGCGMGDLHDYLAETGYAGRYMGVDIVPEFVEIAARKFDGNDRAEARCIDVMKEPLPEGCDYALLSGVFNNRMDDNRGFLEHTLRAMWTAAAKGIAFNALSTHVEYFDDALYYISPEEIFTFVKKTLGGHVRIRQDYVLSEGGYPYEFTVYAYKAPVVV